MSRQIDTGFLVTLSGVTAALALAAGTALKRLVIPGPTFALAETALSVVVVFVTTMAVALGLAAVARVVATGTGLTQGFWPAFGLFMQDLALWFLIRWLLIWGVPFSVGMSLTVYLMPRLGNLASGTVGVCVAILIIVLLRRVLPEQIWVVSAKFDPTNYFGWQRSVVIFLVLTSAGQVYLQSLYRFEVSASPTTLGPADSLEVRAHLSGRITNHDRLVAELVRVTKPGAWKSPPVAFDTEEPGSYVAWFDAKEMPPGVYRLRVFFRDRGSRSAFQKLSAWLAHQDAERDILVRVRANPPAG